MKPLQIPTSLGGLILAYLLTCAQPVFSANNLKLPDLGGGSTSIVSHQQEYELGQAWLRSFRRRVPAYLDPYLMDYLERLVDKLAYASSLPDKRMSLITVDNPTINAFAAPGGIIGIHTGLLIHARSEHELAAVLAHEMAHLTQRHWIRNLEKARQNQIPTMAALLASLVLIATSNTNAGMAALTATQAASLESALRYSRANEKEADNIGIQTLYQAGFDPQAMADMFDRMLETTRFQGERPPEFLLTHPVTESRIASSKNRATNLPKKNFADSLEFHLIRARIKLHHSENPIVAAKYFQSEINGKSDNLDASHYGLALAEIKNKNFTKAEKILSQLLEKTPDEKLYLLAKAQLSFAQSNFENALEITRQVLADYNQNFATQLLQVEIYRKQHQYAQAEKILLELSQQRPNNEVVWFELAEVSGLSGNISGLHLARAEYFILNGIYDKARQQLNYALLMHKDNFVDSERIKQRLKDVEKLENYTIKIR